MQIREWSPFLERGVEQVTGERAKAYTCDKRFVVVVAGRRSGKSILSRRMLAKRLFIEKKPWADRRYFYAGPTHGQVKRIAWQDFKRLIPKSLIASMSESELWIKTVVGSELHLIGLDAPQRIEGTPWDGGVIDERADIKAGAWDANIRPALSDRNGWCWHIGVPDMEGPSNAEFKTLFERGRSGVDPEWASFTWPSSEILPLNEIESARLTQPANIFRQEYEASFESAPGKAYYEFVSTVHVKETSFVKGLPLYVGCDFNFGHHNWGLYQYRTTNEAGFQQGVYHIVDEIYLADANVERMITATQGKITELGATEVVFYGDYSGEQRRAEATKTAWRQIKDAFPKAEFGYKTQPPIADRLERVNGAFRNAKGELGVVVDPKCKNHIRDFEEVPRTMLFGSNKTGVLTHASDAFGYFVYEHQRKIKRSSIDHSQLGKALGL